MNIIIKSLLNGIASCLLLALILTLTKHVDFVQALVEPTTLILAPCAAVGSYFGYRFRVMRGKDWWASVLDWAPCLRQQLFLLLVSCFLFRFNGGDIVG